MARYQYPPLSSWDEFERMCKDLYSYHWDTEANLYGRKGTFQNGVDVYAYKRQIGKIFTLQCKGKEIYPEKKVQLDEIRAEIEKAKKFKPEIYSYTFTTTARRCPDTQSKLLGIVEELNPNFDVDIKFWDDLVELIEQYPYIQEKYYPQYFPSKNSKESLFQRASFNDGVNIIDIYDSSDDHYVFVCPYYNLMGTISENYLWLNLGVVGIIQPPTKRRILNSEINMELISNAVEDFFINEVVDSFQLSFQFDKGWGSVTIGTESACICGEYYVEDGVVYDCDGIALDRLQSIAYFKLEAILKGELREILSDL